MLRQRTLLALVAAIAAGSVSLAAAAGPSLDAAAEVGDRAQRIVVAESSPPAPDQRAAEDLILIINIERGNRGQTFFLTDSRVAAAAAAHAADMAAMRSVQHQGSDGSDAGDRLIAEGFTWSRWAENLGGGFVDPQALFDAWMGSPSHRANLLGDFQYVGVGTATASDGTPYWSLVVANP